MKSNANRSTVYKVGDNSDSREVKKNNSGHRKRPHIPTFLNS